MRGLVTICLVLGVSSSVFAESEEACKKALVGSSQAIRSVYRLKPILKAKSFENLSDREKAILAKAKNYIESHDAQIAAELVVLGASEEDVVRLMKDAVLSELTVLEGEGPQLKLFNAGPRLAGSKSSEKSIRSLEDYSNLYSMSGERELLSGIIGYRFSLKDGIRPDNLLKAALMTGDRNLTERALRQALKFGYFGELTAIAAEGKDNSALIQLGRINIARYLYFDRNSNWLKAALRSFSEVTGSDHDEVQAMLLDLHDLLRSTAILANESEIRTYDTPGVLANYDQDALTVLVASLPMKVRLRGDSSAGFVYQYHRTADSRFIDRLEAQIQDAVSRQRNIGIFGSAILQLEEPARLLRLAKMAEAYSQNPPSDLEEDRKVAFARGALRVAANAYVMSGDLDEITAYAGRMIADPRFKPSNRPIDFARGEEAVFAPSSVVDLFHQFIHNPKMISDVATAADLSSIKDWMTSYYYERGEAKGEVTATSKIFFESRFEHEKKSIQTFLERGNNARPEKIIEFQKSGEKFLSEHNFWEAMSAFISARDLDGLERTYAAIMTNGRSLDAVYVALAMEWIRSGEFSVAHQLPPQDSQPLLERPRTGVDISGDFDPVKAWRQAGLDPEKVSVRIENYPEGAGNDNTPAMEVALYYDGHIKMGELGMFSKSDKVWGTYSELEPDFKGKGIGALLYLIGTESMFKLYPKATRLESWDGSVDANYMWEKLVNSKRAAKKIQSDDVRFLYRIERKHMSEKFRQYVETMKRADLK